MQDRSIFLKISCGIYKIIRYTQRSPKNRMKEKHREGGKQHQLFKSFLTKIIRIPIPFPYPTILNSYAYGGARDVVETYFKYSRLYNNIKRPNGELWGYAIRNRCKIKILEVKTFAFSFTKSGCRRRRSSSFILKWITWSEVGAKLCKILCNNTNRHSGRSLISEN